MGIEWHHQQFDGVTRPSIFPRNMARVASFNIQRSQNLNHLANLIFDSKFDFVLLQEFALPSSYNGQHRLEIFQPSRSSSSAIAWLRGTVDYDLSSVDGGPFREKWSIVSQNNLQFPTSTPMALTTFTSDMVIHHNDSGQYFWLISTYSPCESTPLHRGFHKCLHEAIRATYCDLRDRYNGISTILGGDFNYDPARTIANSRPHHVRYRTWAEFEDLAQELGLNDAFLQTAPAGTQGHTNGKTGHGSRLDRLYTSPSVTDKLLTFSIHAKFAGTHHGISMAIILDPECELALGPGRYTLRPEHLWNLFIDDWFSFIPPSTYAAATRLMRTVEIKTRQVRKSARKRVPSLITPPAKQTLKDFRPRVQPTYFHALRATPESDYVTSTSGMLKIAREFYATLYQAVDSPDPYALQSWLSILDGRQLSDVQREALEAPFTLPELESALNSMNSGATPGSDGITITTLKDHWTTIGPLLVSAAESLQNGTLPVGFKDVIITLIPKNNAAESISDFRPISLSQTGLNVMAKAMNTRFLKYADTIIGTPQRGFIPGRRIDENTTEVLSLIRKIREDDEDTSVTAIALLDQSKAFDRVSHHYLERVLTKFGLGPKAVSFAMAITSQQWGRVEINKTFSAPFPLSGGVRQGNPLSPTLYILSLEPLLAHIDKNLNGVTLSSGHRAPSYCAYADDMAVFISGNSEAVELSRLLDIDAEMSGSKINKDKSVLYAFDLNLADPLRETLSYQLKRFDDDQFKYLGVAYEEMKWTHTVNQQIWKMASFDLNSYPRHLRAQAINYLVLPKLIYRDLTSPIPDADVERLDSKLCSTFFRTINKDRVYGPIGRGGYGLINFKQQLLGRRAKMIYELFQTCESSSWAKLDLIDRIQSAISTGTSGRHTRGGVTSWFELLLSGNVSTINGSILNKVKDNLEDREKSWLDAWFAIVERKKDASEISDSVPIADRPQTYLRGRFDADDVVLSISTFHSLHKKSNAKLDWLDIPTWVGRHLTSRNAPPPSDWKLFWRDLSKFTLSQPWESSILWEFYHGYVAAWMWTAHTTVDESQYASFFTTGCTLCLVGVSPDETIDLPAVRNEANQPLFAAQTKLIRTKGANERHTYCECPVSQTVYRLVNQQPTPYRTVSDMLPPRRLNSVAFKELARFLRAVFLLFKESRLSHEAPAFWAEADLRTWIEQHQRYIETGKGQGIH
ncbi:unnamed protein product [Diutina rugosa]